MTIRKGSASVPNIPGAESLARFTEWRHFITGLNNGDAMSLNGLTRNLDTLPQAMFRVITGAVPTYQNIDKQRTMLVQSAAAQASNMAFRPWINAPNPVLGWRDTYVPLTGPIGDVPPIGRWTIQAWARKLLAGSVTWARTTFGFGDNTALLPSGPVARCGLIGDGLLGFRFGSVHCPDGLAAGETPQAAIDANFIQPPELVNPGANWFHVKIVMVPPTPTQTGRWAAYLNGRLIKVFDSPVNFPRGTQGVDRNYAQVEATIYSFFDASVIPGVYYHDLRVAIDDDAQVPGA